MDSFALENRKKQIWLWGGTSIGVLVGAAAIVISVVVAGGGHGSYVPAKLLFPYTMLSTLYVGVVSLPFIVLAIAQFPLYGALIGIAGGRGKTLYVSVLIILVHFIAVVMCFLLLRGGSFDP